MASNFAGWAVATTAQGRASPSARSVSSRCRPVAVCGQGTMPWRCGARRMTRSEEHTSELQSLMRISYAVFCLKKKKECNNQPTRSNAQHHSYINRTYVIRLSQTH